MPRVVLAQALCPQRHAILALAGVLEDDEIDTPEKLDNALHTFAYAVMKKALDGIESNVINSWCGICKADWKTWKAETALTEWTSLAEAMPHLKKVERDNERTRMAIEQQEKARNN